MTLPAFDRIRIERAHAEAAWDDRTPVLVSQVDALFPGQGTRIARQAWELRPQDSIGPGDALRLKNFVAGGIPRDRLVRGLMLSALARLR